MSQWARNNPEEARLQAYREDLAMQQYYEDRDNPKEECVECFEQTGRTGGEDALHRADGTGPLCQECFDKDTLIIAIEHAQATNQSQAENVP